MLWQRDDFRNRLIAPADHNAIALAQALKIFREMRLGLVDIEPNHGLILDHLVN